jgi:signal transduction histidine kinase
MNVHLMVHDILYGLDIAIVFFLIGLIVYKAQSGVAKVMLVITWVCVIVFVLSHMIGVSVADPILSRNILMFNMVDIFLPLSSAHAVFALLGKQREQRKVLISIYAIAFSLVGFYVLYPNMFLLPSVPKLYFPNYYVAGPYYWLMLVFFFSLTLYFLAWMRHQYLNSDTIERKRIFYFFISLLFGYVIGSLDFFLIYNIHVDPLWGFLFVPFSAVPFTYAALQYNLMNISVVGKRALIYAIIVAFIGIFFVGIDYLNVFLAHAIPGFPNWIPSLLLALLGALAVYFIWNKARESDILKYEFINVVTHKFRTPLTSIKWITEEMTGVVPAEFREGVQQIKQARERLVDLTNLLVNVSAVDDKSYEYVVHKINLINVLRACVLQVRDKALAKDLDISFVPKPDTYVVADEGKIRFVFQTLLDNAVSYTPVHGKILIDIVHQNKKIYGKNALIRISDTGIGIPKNELKYIFTKFYRAQNGKKADTEGMGIGLYLSKKIIERHRGSISIQSPGEGLGTTFTITLPVITM